MSFKAAINSRRCWPLARQADGGLAWHRHVRPMRAVIVANLCFFAVGCTPSPFQYVEGVVMLDGVPLDGALVTFRSTAKDGGMAAGMTDADGRYRLNPLEGTPGAGAKVGEFGVTVLKARSLGDGRSEPITPPRYASAATSGLKVTIKQGRNTGPEFSFDLKSDRKAK